MKYYELDPEEKDLLGVVERGEYRSVPHVRKEVTRYRLYFTETLNRNRNINIRISERDLHKLKVKAQEEGLPYQTLITSLLHKFVSR